MALLTKNLFPIYIVNILLNVYIFHKINISLAYSNNQLWILWVSFHSILFLTMYTLIKKDTHYNILSKKKCPDGMWYPLIDSVNMVCRKTQVNPAQDLFHTLYPVVAIFKQKFPLFLLSYNPYSLGFWIRFSSLCIVPRFFGIPLLCWNLSLMVCLFTHASLWLPFRLILKWIVCWDVIFTNCFNLPLQTFGKVSFTCNFKHLWFSSRLTWDRRRHTRTEPRTSTQPGCRSHSWWARPAMDGPSLMGWAPRPATPPPRRPCSTTKGSSPLIAAASPSAAAPSPRPVRCHRQNFHPWNSTGTAGTSSTRSCLEPGYKVA